MTVTAGQTPAKAQGRGIPGVSAAELDVMADAAAAFLRSQGSSARSGYDWPPDDFDGHKTTEPGSEFRELATAI